MTVTWLHLSDRHACERDQWPARRIQDELIKDLERLRDREDLRPDFVFFTGDAAYGHLGEGPGETLAEQFQLFDDFLKDVRGVWSLPRRDVFLVPGNHDVSRAKVPRYLDSVLRTTNDLHAIEELIENADEEWRLIVRRLEDYRSYLERAGFDHLLADPERLIHATTREAGGLTVGIAGFNSAWSCSRSGERGHLWMAGRWQQERLRPELAGSDLRIALMHHPTSWLVEHESPHIGRALQQDYHFLLHGHEHVDWVEMNDLRFVKIAAAACYQRPDIDKNGYDFVRLDPAAGRARVWLRRYDPDGGGWVPRVIHRQTGDDGVRELRLDYLRQLGAGAPGRRARVGVAASPAPAAEPLAHHESVIRYLQCLRSQSLQLRPGSRSFMPVPVDVETSYVPLRADVHVTELGEAAPAGVMDLEQVIRRAREDYDRKGVVVRGEPGSGKTTFLKKLVLALTAEETEPEDLGLPREVVPVMIELAHVDRPQDGLLHAIAEAIQRTDPAREGDPAGAEGLARELLRCRYLLLLIDGLDEVIGHDTRKAVAAWIEQEAQRRPDWTFVVTSGYQDSQAVTVLRGPLLELRLRGLDEEQVRHVVRRWNQEIARSSVERTRWPQADEQAEIESDDLLRRLFDGDAAALRPLTANFLTLQALSQVHRRLGGFPERPVELYAECVEALLEVWREKKKLPRSQDPSSALKLLRPLAGPLVTPAGAVPEPVAPVTPVAAGEPGERRAGAERPRRAEPGDERIHPADGSVLVWVPAGTYVQGSEELTIDERPRRSIELDGFWISKYPVVNEQFRAFLEAQPEQPEPTFWRDSSYDHPRQPVVGVDWHQARAYCRWAGLHLPSEAQWEAAARGSEGRTYPWGEDPPGTTLANFNRNVGRTSPVDSYPDGAGPFGTFDQAGNVWEWCDDVWDGSNYEGEQIDPRTGRCTSRTRPAAGDPPRCIRGGAWWEEPWKLNAAFRNWCGAGVRELDVGFRCVLRVSSEAPDPDAPASSEG